MIHDLDIPHRELDAVLNGRSTFELPGNEQGIEIGDRLHLHEREADADARGSRELVVEVVDLVERDDDRVELVVRRMPLEGEGPVS